MEPNTNMQPTTPQPSIQQPVQPQQPGMTIAGRRIPLWGVIGGVAAILVVLFCGCCGSVSLLGALTSNGQATAQATATTAQQSVEQATATTAKPTATATPKPQPKIVLHFSGNGDKSSKTFTVQGTWQISWTCSGVPSSLGDAPLYVYVYNASDNSLNWDDEVSYNCPSGKGGSDSSVFHDSGTFYLKTNTGITWDITVTDLPD